MCKSRLRVVEQEELERNKQKKTKMDVFTFEVHDTVEDLNKQLKDSNLKFIRKMGTLKYLKHLEQNKELEDCPICHLKPEHKVTSTKCENKFRTWPAMISLVIFSMPYWNAAITCAWFVV